MELKNRAKGTRAPLPCFEGVPSGKESLCDLTGITEGNEILAATPWGEQGR